MPRGLVRRAVLEALRREGVETGELSVTFVGDDEITKLHRRYLDIAAATDVLSFRLYADGEDPVGDIYVGHAQALRQASEAGADSDEELTRLAVHGTLHVVGYDHPDGSERRESEMYLRQEKALSAVIGRPSATSGAGARR